MICRNPRLTTSPSALAAVLMTTAGIAPAAAQTTTQMAQATELPPIVVEGATLEAKPKSRVKAPKATSPTVTETPQPAPASTPAGSAQGGAVAGGVPVPVAPDATDSDGAPVPSDSAGTVNVSGVETRKIATPVSVVTGAELRARQIRNAADALRSLPGVAVSASGGPANLTQVRIRGAEGNHTLVLIDGVEANDTNSGEFDFSNLSADEIERIEVLRGVQSGLYGSRAIGGVINIITRGGKGPLTFRANSEGGSFGTRHVSGGVSAGNDRGYIAANLSYREADGFNISEQGNEDDAWQRSTFNLRSGAAIAEGLSVDMNLRRSATRADFDAFDFFAPPGQLIKPTDAENVADSTIWLGGAKLTWEMLGGALTHQVGGNFNQTTTTSEDAFSTTRYDNDRVRFNYLATARLGTEDFRHIVSGLVETERETFTPSIPFFTDGLERERERLAYAAEWRAEMFDRFFPIASVRHEDNDTFADFTTWKTGLSIDVRELGLRPHASVGTAVALPGMFEQFGAILGLFVGNPNLVPEESFGWDAGVEFTLLRGTAVVDVTYFAADLKNEIVGFGNSLINLTDDSERRGIEVAGRMEVVPGLVVGAAYTWLDASDPTGLAEVRRPEHAARFDVNYAFDRGRGNLNVGAIYNGEMADVAFFNAPPPVFFGSQRVTLDEYWLVNVAASYKMMPGVEIFGRVENLLNEDYQDVFGFETADIAAYAGLRLTYEEPASIAWSQGR